MRTRRPSGRPAHLRPNEGAWSGTLCRRRVLLPRAAIVGAWRSARPARDQDRKFGRRVARNVGRPGRLDARTRPRFTRRADTRERSFVYAIVRCGRKQSRAAGDDVLTVDKLAGQVGSTVSLPAVLIADVGKVIKDSAQLGTYEVTAEIIGPA